MGSGANRQPITSSGCDVTYAFLPAIIRNRSEERSTVRISRPARLRALVMPRRDSRTRNGSPIERFGRCNGTVNR
jgi:hypothetical protein